MSRFHPMMARFVALAMLACVPAVASDIGDEITGQISMAIYTHYHADLLYTHVGNNRGLNGTHHNLARNNIQSTFQSFGLTVELDPFTYSGTRYNVVATQLGTLDPDVQYIIGAHYDSVNNPGADDNASGVAGIMEIARVMSLYETEYTIKYIAFDAEESGLIGSDAYATEYASDDIAGMISMDMIAYRGTGYGARLYGRTASNPLKNALRTAMNLYGNGITTTLYGTMDASDHAPFEWVGFQACCLIETNYASNPCYHKSCDTVEQPNYIDYGYATDMTRGVAGYLADNAGAIGLRPCLADLDGNNVVEAQDLALLLAAYGLTDDGDLDHDGDTDAQDLSYLLLGWGEVCP